MQSRSLGLSLAAIILVQVASVSAAYAGSKTQHNSDVKAQCISDGKASGLQGNALYTCRGLRTHGQARGLKGKALYHDVVECFHKSGFTH